MAAISSLLLAVTSAFYIARVLAHGGMTQPTIFPITDTYRADCLWGLKGAGDQELQWAPLENLQTRGQDGHPAAATFDMMNGCRGIVYEAGGPTTSVKAGEELPVKWTIQAPHPGYLELYLVKPKTDSTGKVKYEQQGAALKRVDNFATDGGDGSTSVTLPSSVSSCTKTGDCALQFYWYSASAKQTYVTCAAIVTGGSGGGSSSKTTPSAATSTATSKAPATSPTPVANEYENTTPVTPSKNKKSCNKRMRRNRQ